MIVLAYVVPEEQMPRPLDGGEENVVIAVIIEVGKQGGAAICNRIDSRHTGDVKEFLPLAVHEQGIALIPAKGETLLEHQATLIVAQCSRFFRGVTLRHDLTPKLASRVFHGLAGDEPVRRVNILPTVVVEIDKAATPGPSGRQAANVGGHVPEITFARVLVQAVA